MISPSSQSQEVRTGQRPAVRTCRLSGMEASFAGATDPGLLRATNEDGLLLLPEAGVFAVADGLGGLDAGDVASRLALSVLKEQCSRQTPAGGGDALLQLGTTIAEVNRRVHAQRQNLGKTMATTLSMVQFHEGMVLAAHVGDSRLYRWHEGSLTQLTSDHSLVNALCEKGVMTPSQARVSPQRHVITRAIGAESVVHPTIKPLSMQPGDLLLLCTDGLTGMVSDEGIAACLEHAAADPGLAVQRLIELANRAGGHDNITVVVVQFEPASTFDGMQR